MRLPSLVGSTVLALLALAPVTADARPKKGGGKASPKVEAKAHMNKAAKAHKAGKFEEALTELQAAYDLDPQPKLLFGIAQVQQKLDRCSDAIPNYEKFLEATKDKSKQSVVKQAIDACQTKLAQAPATMAPTTPPATTDGPFRTTKPAESPLETTPAPAVEPTAPVAPAEPVAPVTTPAPSVTEPYRDPRSAQNPAPCCAKPWYKDALGDTLVLAGVAAGAVSIVMYTGARGALDDAEAANTLPAYEDLVDKAHDKRLYAVIAGAGSVVLIGAGIVRYRLRDKHEVHGWAVAPARGGGGLVTWTGGF